jgi:hypothetical protein
VIKPLAKPRGFTAAVVNIIRTTSRLSNIQASSTSHQRPSFPPLHYRLQSSPLYSTLNYHPTPPSSNPIRRARRTFTARSTHETTSLRRRHANTIRAHRPSHPSTFMLRRSPSRSRHSQPHKIPHVKPITVTSASPTSTRLRTSLQHVVVRDRGCATCRRRQWGSTRGEWTGEARGAARCVEES